MLLSLFCWNLRCFLVCSSLDRKDWKRKIQRSCLPLRLRSGLSCFLGFHRSSGGFWQCSQSRCSRFCSQQSTLRNEWWQASWGGLPPACTCFLRGGASCRSIGRQCRRPSCSLQSAPEPARPPCAAMIQRSRLFCSWSRSETRLEWRMARTSPCSHSSVASGGNSSLRREESLGLMSNSCASGEAWIGPLHLSCLRSTAHVRGTRTRPSSSSASPRALRFGKQVWTVLNSPNKRAAWWTICSEFHCIALFERFGFPSKVELTCSGGR